MKIYELDFNVNNYRTIDLCEDIFLDLYPKFDGRRLREDWVNPEVKECHEELKKGDAPGFILPTFNKKALEHLLPLIEKDVEVLPFKFKDDFLYGINVITLMDAVNYELSEYETFSDGKRIMCFDKLVLKEEKIVNYNIFKLKDIPRGEVYVSEIFVDCVKKNHLEGFEFRLVYDSENINESDSKQNSCVKEDNQMNNFGPEFLYDDKEIEEVDKFIVNEYGSYAKVLHEIVSPDIHLDICIVDPTDEEPYYKLVTMGAGAYRMNVPQKYEKYDINYAEYIICLPKDWNLESSDENDYWPIRLLKDVARLPINCDTWLTYGHTTQFDENGTAYATNTRLNSAVLDFAEGKSDDARLELSNGKIINFYLIIPLYPEELKFKMENNVDVLIKKFLENEIEYKVLNLNRKNLIIN